MPALIPHITVDLHKLLQYRTITSGTFRRESCRVVEVTINIAVVFVVRILGTKESGADRASEMLHVKLLVCTRRQKRLVK